MTSIACDPKLFVSYFQTECDNIITLMGRILFINSINMGLAIRLYKKKVVIL